MKPIPNSSPPQLDEIKIQAHSIRNATMLNATRLKLERCFCCGTYMLNAFMCSWCWGRASPALIEKLRYSYASWRIGDILIKMGPESFYITRNEEVI